MKNVYIIQSGKILLRERSTDISFALVHLERGVYSVETFFLDPDFYDKNGSNDSLKLIGKTEKGIDIEIDGLSYTLYETANRKATFTSNQWIRLLDNRKSTFDKDEPSEDGNGDHIFFVEIEGLKMHFSDHTEFKKIRSINDEHSLLDIEFDHTSCAMQINDPRIIGNTYHLLFYKSPESSNIILDFRFCEGYSRLTLKSWQIIKHDFIMFLSFINGGRLFVRKELCGKFYSETSWRIIDAQDTFVYSREELPMQRNSDYIPINDHHSYSGQIFNQVFLHCFDKYYHLNKVLDLNDLVFSLNNARTTHGLKERYYVMITAFEMVCNNFSKSEKPDSRLIDEALFNGTIRPALLSVINEMKDQLNPKAIEVFRSRLSNLNLKGDTSEKMLSFLEYSRIPLNKNVRQFVDVERHKAVHEGSIGNTTEEMVQNYWKLDHILRDCILNLVGYSSYRRKVFHYDKPD